MGDLGFQPCLAVTSLGFVFLLAGHCPHVDDARKTMIVKLAKAQFIILER